MKIQIAALLVIVNISLGNCQNAPSFAYKVLKSTELSKEMSAEAKQVLSGGFDLTKALPGGYVTDGSVDYTSYLQQGISQHGDVIMPDFPVLVNETGLNLKSNSNILFKANSKLLLKPNSSTKYNVLKLFNIQNVNLYYPHIVGDRKNHTGTTGEWGMGISMKAAVNVNIYSPQVSECWGDGIYIGQLYNKPCKDVAIYDARLDYNRRNGISIICADGLKIIKPVISNTFGISPGASIDVEPNNNNDVVNNVVIESPYTFNSKDGVLIVLGKLAGEKKTIVNLTVNNHIDEGSYTGLYISGFNKPKDGLPYDGTIRIVNPTWRNNKQPFRKKKQYEYAPNIEFTNVSIVRSSADGNDRKMPDSLAKIKGLFKANGRIKFN